MPLLSATSCLTRAMSMLQHVSTSWLLTRETSPCAAARWQARHSVWEQGPFRTHAAQLRSKGLAGSRMAGTAAWR